MRYILLLLIIVPVAEIAVILLSGNLIGIWPTIGLLLFTGLLGAYLAKKQGLDTMRKVQTQLQNGQIPGEAILDGICILAGGILLLSPGFITDLTGLLLLAPPSKKVIKRLMKSQFEKWIEKNTFTIIR